MVIEFFKYILKKVAVNVERCLKYVDVDVNLPHSAYM